MSIQVLDAVVLDPAHHNGDAFWDGDQSLWRVRLLDTVRGAHGHLGFAVPRGNGFISRQAVSGAIERRFTSFEELLSVARRPSPGRALEVVLPIEPPGDDG